MNSFPEIKKKLGFGCMRLPNTLNHIDTRQTKAMVDAFLAAGFNYFDTAHGYHLGNSETAVKRCLTSRYPRDAYLLTNKLTQPYFRKQQDIVPFFERQLKRCGVSYFDFYLMHAQNKDIFEHFKRCRAYETALELRAAGKIRHFGISFHDKPEVLRQILTEYPEIEVVQIQYNYLDYYDSAVQSKACYDVCAEFDKPVIVMEPIRGGRLINLPEDAKAVVDELNISPAELALRFAATPDNVVMVLSGMSTIDQVRDNVSFMSECAPLTAGEIEATERIAQLIHQRNMIACTGCRYCVEGCPQHIAIPDLFTLLNSKKHFNDWNAKFYYTSVYTAHGGKAKDCIGCGKCEKICPQQLPIRSLLKEVSKEFDHFKIG